MLINLNLLMQSYICRYNILITYCLKFRWQYYYHLHVKRLFCRFKNKQLFKDAQFLIFIFKKYTCYQMHILNLNYKDWVFELTNRNHSTGVYLVIRFPEISINLKYKTESPRHLYRHLLLIALNFETKKNERNIQLPSRNQPVNELNH